MLAVGLSAVAMMGTASAQTHASPNAASGARVAVAHATPFSSYWTLSMTFDTGTYTYYLDPLTKTGRKLSGTAIPPNTSCPASLSGTLVRGALNLTMTFGGNCVGDSAVLSGTMKTHNLHPTKGVTSGTFTANFQCAATCSFSGNRTS
jgi:hypothetical protein